MPPRSRLSAPGEGAHAVPRDAGRHQALRPGPACQRRRRFLRGEERDPRRGRRERGRQDHADEDPRRAGAARRGDDPAGRQAGPHPQPPGCGQAGHRHGAPALQAHPRVHRGAERRPGRRAAAMGPVHGQGEGPRAGRRGDREPRVRHRSRGEGRRSHRGTDAAGGDREDPLPQGRAPHAGRADLRAHRAGDPGPLRHPAQPAQGRQDLHHHHAQAARGEGDLRQGHRHAQGPGGGGAHDRRGGHGRAGPSHGGQKTCCSSSRERRWPAERRCSPSTA